MALNWDVSAVKDYETLCWIEEENPPSRGPGTHTRTNPVTEAIVFHTVAISMGRITEANADEFYARVHFVEQHQGSSVKKPAEVGGGWEDRYITLEDVKAHIGLTTNASNEALGRWLTRNFKYFYKLKVN